MAAGVKTLSIAEESSNVPDSKYDFTNFALVSNELTVATPTLSARFFSFGESVNRLSSMKPPCGIMQKSTLGAIDMAPNKQNPEVSRGLVSLVVAVSGHRDLVPDQIDSIRQHIASVLKELADCYRYTPIVVISGMAEGADQLAVEAVIQLPEPYHDRVSFRPILPMPQADFAVGLSDVGQNSLREKIAGRTVTVLPIHPCYSLKQVRVLKSEARRQQYRDLAEFLVNSSQILIAVWDGHPGKTGGTGEVVNRKLGIWEMLEGEVSDAGHRCERMEHYRRPKNIGPGINALGIGPVYHIDADRAGEADHSAEVAVTWIYPEGKGSAENGDVTAQDAYASIYRLIDEYNRDVIKNPGLAAHATGRFKKETGAASVTHCPPGMQWVAGVRSWSATLAQHYRGNTDRVLMAVFALLAISGGALHAMEHYTEIRVLGTIIYYLGAFSALVLWLLENGWIESIRRCLFDPKISKSPSDGPFAQKLPARGLKSRRKHEDYRALSEALRVQFYWLAAGIERMAATVYLEKHAGDMTWVRHATSDVLLHHWEESSDPHQDNVLSQSLVHKWTSNQLEYFKSSSRKLERKHWLLNGFAVALFVPAFFGPGIYLWIVMHYHGIADAHDKLLSVATAIAVFLAIMGWNFAELKGYEPEALQYDRMIGSFRRACNDLERLFLKLAEVERHDPENQELLNALTDDIRNRLIVVGQDALAENGDWLAMHRGRDLKMIHGAGG